MIRKLALAPRRIMVSNGSLRRLVGCGIKSKPLILKTEMFICQTKANLGVKILLVKSLSPHRPRNRPNRPRFVLPISSDVTIPLGTFSIMLLFAFMAQL